MRQQISGLTSTGEKLAWKLWRKASLSRKMMNRGNKKIKNWLVNKAFSGWTAHRAELGFFRKNLQPALERKIQPQ